MADDLIKKTNVDEFKTAVPIPENEAENNSVGGAKAISFHRFFTYNTRKDNIMLIIGTIGSIIAGLFLPSISIIMGSIANNFGDGDLDPSEMSDEIINITKWVALVAVVILVFAYIFFAFW